MCVCAIAGARNTIRRRFDSFTANYISNGNTIKIREMEENQVQTYYYIDFGGGSTYFKVIDSNTIVCRDKAVTMPLQRFIDFINTARELGLNAGKL